MVSKLDRLIEDYHSLECEFDIDRSIEVCEKILKIDPTLIEYRVNLGSSYFNRKDYDKTIEIFTECMEKGNEKDTYNFMIALSYAKLNNMEKAFEYIERIDDEEKYLKARMKIHMELKEYDDAIIYGDRALELNPENRFALRNMSDIYSELGDTERSMFYFCELANIDPELKGMEIVWLFSLRKYDEMIETFEKYKDSGVLNDELEDPTFNYYLGQAYYFLKRPYESLKYLICSDRLIPKLSKKTLIAKNYFGMYEFHKAHKYLLQALETDPLDYNTLLLITETSFYINENYQAIGYANTLLNNYEDEDTVFRILAAIYFDLGDVKTGWKCVGMSDNPEDYGEDYILEIARRLSKSGQSERALKLFATIEEKIPEFPFTYIERAKHYKRIGEIDLAKRDFEKYNELWWDKIDNFEDL